jgi:hypothetical protein
MPTDILTVGQMLREVEVLADNPKFVSAHVHSVTSEQRLKIAEWARTMKWRVEYDESLRVMAIYQGQGPYIRITLHYADEE